MVAERGVFDPSTRTREIAPFFKYGTLSENLRGGVGGAFNNVINGKTKGRLIVLKLDTLI
jgi:hypothetical protein